MSADDDQTTAPDQQSVSDQPTTPGHPTLERPARRTVLGIGAASVGTLLGAGALASPRPGNLGESTGDRRLASALVPHLTGQRTVAAALIEGGTTRYVGFGADQHREFEIGSMTKTFTAALVMDAVDRGELALQDTVADVLGDRASGAAVADVSIQELASHTSGIPSLPSAVTAKNIWRTPLHRDPYAGFDAEAVIDLALAAELVHRGKVVYSNHGVALEGQLLAVAAGTSWETLLHKRLIDPMRLREAWAPITADHLPANAPTGHAANGHRSGAWTMDGFAAAGGIRSTATDIASWLRSMMDGSNPGAHGIEPVARQNETTQVGINWFTSQLEGGGSAVWHNGETGGFHSFCGWSPETERGWVMLSDTATPDVDDLSMRVLSGEVLR